MPTVLSREDILNAKDTKIEFVETPEWAPDDPDAGVYVKGLSGVARDSFEMAMLEQRRITSAQGKKKNVQVVNLKNLRAKLVVRCAVDHPDPELAHEIFTMADVEALGEKNAAPLNRIYAKARELSGLSDEDVDELTAELGEDSSDASGSSSLLPSGTEASPSANDGSTVENSQSGWPTTESSPSATDD